MFLAEKKKTKKTRQKRFNRDQMMDEKRLNTRTVSIRQIIICTPAVERPAQTGERDVVAGR